MNYRSYALFNARTSNYPDIAELFAQKAVGAFSGERPFPESIDNWQVESDSERFELFNAYNNLMTQLQNNDVADEQPKLAAESQAKFDCWLSAAASGQNATAAECKHRFKASLQALIDCADGKVVTPTHVKSQTIKPTEVTEKYYPESVSSQNYKDIFLSEIKSKADEHDKSAIEKLNEMKKLFSRLVNPQSISFILEEPEQNLFPKTQVELFNDIISLCEGEHKSSVFITTHSPYILSAANILLFAGKLIEQGVDADEIANAIKTKTVINTADFSAYSVSDGTCTSIIDEKTHLIKENELDSASDYNADVFDTLYKKFVNSLQRQ
jgi:hypothetical protein